MPEELEVAHAGVPAIVQRDGGWFVRAGDADLAGPFETHARAWRALDRMQEEPVKPDERWMD